MLELVDVVVAVVTGIGGDQDVCFEARRGLLDHQHLTEQRLDRLAKAADEPYDVCMAWLAVATDGDELNVAQADVLDGAAGDDALAVGQQHDLEHDLRIVGAGAHCVVLEFGIHSREIKLVVDQVVQGECEAARNQLL